MSKYALKRGDARRLWLDRESEIAAEPDLLAACKAALPLIEQDIKDCGPCDHAVNVCVCGCISVAEQLRAAIAKAEGR